MPILKIPNNNVSSLYSDLIILIKKNLLASFVHSHRALREQLASIARMSAPGARDLMVFALRATRSVRPYGTHSHHDTRASRSILRLNFCNSLKI